MLTVPVLGQRRRTVRPYAASWSALRTLDGAILMSRAMTRTPSPFALSLLTSAARLLMIAGEDALRRWASFAGTAQSHDALVGCGLTDNHRYNVGREIWSVWQMALTAMLLSAWSFFAV